MLLVSDIMLLVSDSMLLGSDKMLLICSLCYPLVLILLSLCLP